jgi:hypothetical protein
MSSPWRDVLAANDPGNLEAVGAWLAHANRHDALDPKVAELVTVAAALGARAPATVRGGDLPSPHRTGSSPP